MVQSRPNRLIANVVSGGFESINAFDDFLATEGSAWSVL